ncbi:hypothetical protein Pelo_17899 [Pelomyxa schiedti]|nr:hypothetical protein Pelo_17899 [Pelomyxa schiedti]
MSSEQDARVPRTTDDNKAQTTTVNTDLGVHSASGQPTESSPEVTSIPQAAPSTEQPEKDKEVNRTQECHDTNDQNPNTQDPQPPTQTQPQPTPQPPQSQLPRQMKNRCTFVYPGSPNWFSSSVCDMHGSTVVYGCRSSVVVMSLSQPPTTTTTTAADPQSAPAATTTAVATDTATANTSSCTGTATPGRGSSRGGARGRGAGGAAAGPGAGAGEGHVRRADGAGEEVRQRRGGRHCGIVGFGRFYCCDLAQCPQG